VLGVHLFSVPLEDTLMHGSEIAGNASLPDQEPLALPLRRARVLTGADWAQPEDD